MPRLVSGLGIANVAALPTASAANLGWLLEQGGLLWFSTGSTWIQVALPSTAAGRALLNAADVPAQRTALGLGTAATTAAGAYVANNSVGSNSIGMSWQGSGNIRVTVDVTNFTLWSSGNSAQVIAGTVTGQIARWNQTTGRYESFDLLGAANTWSASQTILGDLTLQKTIPLHTLTSLGNVNGWRFNSNVSDTVQGGMFLQHRSASGAWTTSVTFNTNGVIFDVPLARRTTGGGWIIVNDSATNVTRGGIWADDDATRLVNVSFNSQFIARTNGQAYINGTNVRVDSGTSTFGGAAYNQGRVEVIGAGSGAQAGVLFVGYLDDAKTIAPIAFGNRSAIFGGAFNSQAVIYSASADPIDVVATGGANALRVNGSTVWNAGNFGRFVSVTSNNSISGNFDRAWNASANAPGGFYEVIHFEGAGPAHALQLAYFGGDIQNYFIRHFNDQNGWGGGSATWRQLWHSGNQAALIGGSSGSDGWIPRWANAAGRYELGIAPLDVLVPGGRLLVRQSGGGRTTIDSVNQGNSAFQALEFTATEYQFSGGRALFSGGVISVGRFYAILQDTRAANPAPGGLDGQAITWDFKARSALGWPGVGNFGGVQTITQWADDSGGGAHQMAYTDDARIFHRYGTRAAGWGAWREVWKSDSADITDTRGHLRDTPVNVQNGNYTFTTDDRGRKVMKTGASAVNYQLNSGFPQGTTIVVRNKNATGNITIVRSGTALRRVGVATDANATIAPWGEALLHCEEGNDWVISGVGVS